MSLLVCSAFYVRKRVSQLLFFRLPLFVVTDKMLVSGKMIFSGKKRAYLHQNVYRYLLLVELLLF